MPVILFLLAAVFLAHFGWLLAAFAGAAAVGLASDVTGEQGSMFV